MKDCRWWKLLLDQLLLLPWIITSTLPFDRWYRDRVQELHGINLAGYEHVIQPEPLPENQELLFEWELTSSADG
jgi:hypothetical protein